MSAERIAADVWRAWNRNGAKDAAETLMLASVHEGYPAGDARLARELLAGIDMLPHIRDGIAGYLPHVTE